MEDKLYSINEIIKWYDNNTDTLISDEFIIFLIKKGIISPKDNSVYSLNEINSFMLETYNNEFVKNSNNRFKVKDNRKSIIEKFPRKNMRKPKKFKITSLDGNKLKLIKLS